MAVLAVQQNNKDSQRIGYFSSIAIGAVSGYSVKWLLPLTSAEKNDARYKAELLSVKRNAYNARLDEIESIRNSNPKLDGADEFVRMADNKKLTSTEIKKLKEPMPEKLMLLLKRINNVMREHKDIGRDELITCTKRIRPTSMFIIIGASVAFGIAVVNNIYKGVPLPQKYMD